MKMYKFANGEWVDITENASLFEKHGMSDFFDQIAPGYPFKFDCEIPEFIQLLNWIGDDMSCLDDADYYNLNVDIDESDWNKIFIFDNYSIQTLDNCITITVNHLKWLIDNKNKM